MSVRKCKQNSLLYSINFSRIMDPSAESPEPYNGDPHSCFTPLVDFFPNHLAHKCKEAFQSSPRQREPTTRNGVQEREEGEMCASMLLRAGPHTQSGTYMHLVCVDRVCVYMYIYTYACGREQTKAYTLERATACTHTHTHNVSPRPSGAHAHVSGWRAWRSDGSGPPCSDAAPLRPSGLGVRCLLWIALLVRAVHRTLKLSVALVVPGRPSPLPRV